MSKCISHLYASWSKSDWQKKCCTSCRHTKKVFLLNLETMPAKNYFFQLWFWLLVNLFVTPHWSFYYKDLSFRIRRTLFKCFILGINCCNGHGRKAWTGIYSLCEHVKGPLCMIGATVAVGLVNTLPLDATFITREALNYMAIEQDATSKIGCLCRPLLKLHCFWHQEPKWQLLVYNGTKIEPECWTSIMWTKHSYLGKN